MHTLVIGIRAQLPLVESCALRFVHDRVPRTSATGRNGDMLHIGTIRNAGTTMRYNQSIPTRIKTLA